MRNLLSILKSSKQPVFLHEYQSHRLTCDAYSYYCPIDCYRTALFVVFDGETQRRFSSARVVLYYDVGQKDRLYTWGVKQLDQDVTYSSADHFCHAPQNDPTLPQLTVAFSVDPRYDCLDYYNITPLSLDDELLWRNNKSVRILIESKHLLTPGTLSVSMTFEHTQRLRTPSNHLELYVFCDHNLMDAAYVTTRTVRVVPAYDTHPNTTIRSLPMELLMKVFEVGDSCAWQHDILSFAQVCRQWSQCAMKVLFAHLESSEWKNHCTSFPTQSLDACEFAKALRKVPVLGLGVQHLDLDQHNGSLACWDHARVKPSHEFSQALITIFRTTKNLQRLRLSLGYSSKSDALFSSLPKLHHLRTLSITQTWCLFSSIPPTKKYWKYCISTNQLARCMAHWPALTSLTVENLIARDVGIGRFFLRPPACSLIQLYLLNSKIEDKDLQYLTASSANTLTHVTLDRMSGITEEGLYVFLNSISRNVTSLTIAHVVFPPHRKKRSAKPVLDVLVDKMKRLQSLNIRCGDVVASERMLHRRSEMFLKNSGSDVPVVRLSFDSVPGIWNCMDREWPGWDW